jgi:hypothetical protein
MKALGIVGVAVLMVVGEIGAGSAYAADQAPGKLLQQAVDPKTGAEIRVFRAAPKDVTIEIKSAGLEIRKRVADGRSEVTLVGSPDQVSVVSTPGSVIVSRGATKIEVTRDHAERGLAARALLASSPTARAAADLLGRLGLAQESPVKHSLMLTRAILLSTWDDGSGFEELRQWTRAEATHIRLTRVAGQWTASQCWAAYAVEAIEAYNDYLECTSDMKWYDLLDIAGCALVYDVRAVGAFAWWLNCVSLMV